MTSLTPDGDALPYAYHSSVWITARLQLGRPLTCERYPHVSRVHARREYRAQIELYEPGATCTAHACGNVCMRCTTSAHGCHRRWSVARRLQRGYSAPGMGRVQGPACAGRHEVIDHKGSYSDHRHGEAGKYRCRAQAWIQ